jgi:putative transposase
MRRYLRNYEPGGTYFFTIVTHQRRQFLTTPLARTCLRSAISHVRDHWPFDVVAVVLLPDHIHAVWRLPHGDANYSLRWQKVKESFTKLYLANGGVEGRRTQSRARRGEGAIWQRRFWEHTCKDEVDLERCVDYLHWNPVKHGLVSRVADYPWSSFHRFVRLGQYDAWWGESNPCPDFELPE